MTHQVTIQPSGNVYSVLDYETILDAAIGAGLNLPYGCKIGSCGACKGKVLSGEVDYGKYQSTVLSEADKAAGLALFCCAKPLSDTVIECRELAALNGIKPRIMPVRVQMMEKLSHDVMALFLKLPSNERMQFLAGQYIEFILKDGKRRAFSLANAPHNDELLELHLRLVPGGAFTEYVFNEMPEKAILRLEGPFGSFYLREDSSKPIIFVAGGTGFAPIKGLIEHMLHQKSSRQMVLYWGVKTLEDLYMPSLPDAWASMHPNFTFIPVLSAPAASDAWQGRTGFVHQAVLDDFADLSAHHVYCCGAPVMVDTASVSFKERGLPVDAFFADIFSYAESATTS